MPPRATFRAPHWPLFALTGALAPLGFISVCVWLDDLAGMNSSSGSMVVEALQLLLLLVGAAWIVARFEYHTLFRVELDGCAIRGRSVIKTWSIQLSEIDAVVPAWRTSWWRADHNRYVVRRSGHRDLFIWCGKGLNDFLKCVGEVDPRLAPSEHDEMSRVENGRGRSGFARALPTS